MNEIKQETFFLSGKELMLLLAAKGIEDIYALDMDHVSVDESEACYLLNSLYQNQFIDSSGENFQIEEVLDEMLNGIKNAERMLLMRSFAGRLQSLCLYQSGNLLILLQTLEKNKRVKITSFPKEGLWDMIKKLREQEFRYAPVLEEEDAYMEILNSKKHVGREKLVRFHNVPFLLEEISVHTGELMGRLLIRFKKNEICIVCKKSKDIHEYAWSWEEMRNQLYRMIGEEDI